VAHANGGIINVAPLAERASAELPDFAFNRKYGGFLTVNQRQYSSWAIRIVAEYYFSTLVNNLNQMQ
jgi:hypothetical protein